MRFLVLGPLEVRGADDEVLPVPGLKERTVLGCLIARSGVVVATDTLIDELWGDHPPRTAEKTLGSYVSRIRRILEREPSAVTIVALGDGYRLDVDEGTVDAQAFEQLAREGRHHLDAGHADDAVDALNRAFGLWRGSAFQDLRHTRVGDAEGERLEELRRSAEEDRTDARLDTGDTGALIADLEAMVREEPLRERRWSQLMLALYRSGRQAEALHAFSRARTHLVEDLAIEPGAELSQLQAAILAQEPLPRRPWSGQPTAKATGTDVCPYKGLARFETSDAGFYFGREQTVARAIARLVSGRFLALVGASGSGKSSLLRAGVMHALEAGAIPGSERWTYSLIRPGEHPLREWSEVVNAQIPPDPQRLVVAIDQFEEVFTSCSDEAERTGLLDAIAGAAQPNGPVAVIVAMRADYYGRCAEHRAFAELLEASQILVGPMDRHELRRAIELPAHEADLDVEEELAETLVEATAGQPGGLPLLETALLELWTRRQDRTLTVDEYLRSGGVEGAVARLAEDAFGRLDAGGRAAAQRILLRLAATGDGLEDVSRQVPLAEFDLDHERDAASAFAVLTDARLVTVSNSVAEVAHEALLREWPRLRAWLDDDAQGRRLHRHLTDAARTWEGSGRDDADLYRGARLAAALEWEGDHERDPNELERAFLERSRSASEGEAMRARRTNRRLRGLLAGVATLLASSLVVGSVALSQRDQARANGLIADARQLAARSLTEKDTTLALLLARQAVEMDDAPETRSALFAALEREPAAIATLHPEGAVAGDGTVWIRLSPDGRLLAAGGGRTAVTIFDTSTLQSRTIDLGHDTVAADFTPDGRTLTVATGDRHLLNIHLNAMSVSEDVRSARGLTALRYSPSGSVLITGEVERENLGLVVAHDPLTLEPLIGSPVRASDTFVTAIAFTPDGQGFVSTSSSILGVYAEDRGTTTLWSTRDLRRIDSYPVSGTDVVVGESGAEAFLAARPSGDESGSSTGFRLATIDLSSDAGNAIRYAASRSNNSDALTGVALGARGTIVTTDRNGELTVWDARLATDEGFRDPASVSMRSPQVSPDRSTAYSVDADGTIVVWDLAGGRRLIDPYRAGSGSRCIGTWFAASTQDLAILQNHASEGSCVSDGVRLVDAATLEGEYTIPLTRSFGDKQPVQAALSPDGSSLALAGGDHIGLWDVDTGAPDGDPFEVPEPRNGWYALYADAFSPDGSTLAVGGTRSWQDATGEYHNEGTVFLLEPESHRVIQHLREPKFPLQWIMFTPDGERLVAETGSGGAPGQVVVWSVQDGTRISDTTVNDAGLYSEDISNDGRFLVIAPIGGVDVRLLDLATMSQVGVFYGGPTTPLFTIDISPSGDMLAGAGEKVFLWDLRSGAALGTPIAGGPDNEAYFSGDGGRLYVVSMSGQGWVIDVDPASWEQRACRSAGRTLTPREWSTFLPDRPYQPACEASPEP